MALRNLTTQQGPAMKNPTLASFIGSPALGVAAAYSAEGSTQVFICGVAFIENEGLQLYFPKGHPFQAQQKITLHLDNRTGVDEYDADLLVYRTSYKGRVTAVKGQQLQVEPLHFEVTYGVSVVHSYNAPGYEHPADERPLLALPETPLTSVPLPDMLENENKIGVLVTQANNQPHTTVLAFLSTPDDDIFFITFPATLKSRLLKRDGFCHFAIDSRAVFTYTKALEWNYSIIEAQAYQVSKTNPLFEPIRELFVEKNPWEVGFFSAPDIEMYHLKARRVILPECELIKEEATQH